MKFSHRLLVVVVVVMAVSKLIQVMYPVVLLFKYLKNIKEGGGQTEAKDFLKIHHKRSLTEIIIEFMEKFYREN